jgi:hypothetical protein
MATKLGEAYVEITARRHGLVAGLMAANRDVETATKKMEARFGMLSAAFTRAGTAMAMGISLPLIGAMAYTVKLASDAEETENKFRVAFKGMASTATAALDKWGKGLGLNAYAMRSMAAQFKLLMNGFGVTSGAATEMSTRLTALVYDLSSLYNVPIEETFTRLTSGLVGETEAVRRFAIDISDARLQEYAFSQGINKSTMQMSQAEKVALRYQMILRGSIDAHGDLRKTIGELANQSRTLKERLTMVGIQFGNVLIPLAIRLAGALNRVADWLMGMTAAQRASTLSWIAFAIILPGVIMLLGQLTGAILTLRTATMVVAATMGTLMKAFGPIGAILAIVTAVVGGIMGLKAASDALAASSMTEADAIDKVTDAMDRQGRAATRLEIDKIQRYAKLQETLAGEAWTGLEEALEGGLGKGWQGMLKMLGETPLEISPKRMKNAFSLTDREVDQIEAAQAKYKAAFAAARKAREAATGAGKSEYASTTAAVATRSKADEAAAKTVLDKVKAMQQEHEAEEQKRRDAIGWGSLGDVWKKAMVAGAQTQFGQPRQKGGITNVGVAANMQVGMVREATAALVREQQITNNALLSITQWLKEHGVSAELIGTLAPSGGT